MDVDPIGGNTRLSRVAEFGNQGPLDGLVEVGVFENEDRCVAAEFER